MVAEYAANLILQHSYTYDKALLEVNEADTQAAENQQNTQAVADDSDSPEPSGNATGSLAVQEVSLNQTLGLEGFDVNYGSYNVTDSYPETFTEDSVFIMKAAEGAKLLILKFNITNQSNGQLELNMQQKDLTYRINLDQQKEYTAKLTVLLNALNTYSGTFAAGETKELILAFQISDSYADNINSISLEISKGGNEYLTSLQ